MSGVALAADGWTVTAQDLPAAIEWDAYVDTWVEVENTGDTSWDSNYALVAVEGVTAAAQTAVDRWAFGIVPVIGVTVPPAGAYRFNFAVIGPPITTLSYELPLMPTAVAAAGSLDCNWMLANPYWPTPVLITTDTAEQATTVSRFFDVQPGTDGAWARFWVEECAGRIPLIVAGFGGNDYRPTLTVTRDQMAVYMARALNLPTAAYEGIFPDDVPASQWAWPWIEALQRAGIVQGFDATHYGPAATVNRDAMAVFVARGMEGGMDVPTGPATAKFTDVPVGFWAYDEVEYCVAHNVVGGYSPTIYEPSWPVTRDQMTVFVYRGFIQPTGTAVVLGGPAVTILDPETAGHYGWVSFDEAPSYEPPEHEYSWEVPGWAYVVFDAARLGTGLAFGGTWDVQFELRGPETPTPTYTRSLSAAEIQAAIDAVTTNSGTPYLVMSWDIPTHLTPGDYVLVVSVEDAQGNMTEIARQPALAIITPP